MSPERQAPQAQHDRWGSPPTEVALEEKVLKTLQGAWRQQEARRLSWFANDTNNEEDSSGSGLGTEITYPVGIRITGLEHSDLLESSSIPNHPKLIQVENHGFRGRVKGS